MKKYDCFFELPYKNIALEVVKGSQNIEFTTRKGEFVTGSVCLRKEDLEDLVSFIQETIKTF